MTSDYEIISLDEVEKLKSEIQRLKRESSSSPASGIANSLDRLANSLERLFKIFEVAATELEQDKLNEKTFEERIEPMVDKLKAIERQNKDIADGVLALADIIKRQSAPAVPKQEPPQRPPMPSFGSYDAPPSFSDNSLPPLRPPRDESPPSFSPPPPPPDDKKGFLGRFK